MQCEVSMSQKLARNIKKRFNPEVNQLCGSMCAPQFWFQNMSLQLWAAQLPSFVDFIPTFGWWYVALAVHPTMLDAQLTGTCHVKTVRGPLEFQTRIWIHLLAHHKKQTNLRFVLKENTKNAIFLDESVYSIFVQMPHVFLPSISCSLVMSSCFLPICVFKFQFLSANNGDTNHLSGECLTSRSIVHLYVFPLKFPGSH